MNETAGPLQQHLHLNAGTTPAYTAVRTTIMEYYRTTTAFSRLQQHSSSAVSTRLGGGWAPMDIGATYKGKGKGKNKGKGYGKGNKGKGYQQGKGYAGYGIHNKRKGQRKTAAMVSGKWRRQRQQRKGKRNFEQRKRKESNRSVLQVWPSKPYGKRMPNSGVQHVRKHCRCKIKIEQHNGMTQTMGTTAAGTGTTSQATTAHNHLSNSNSWLCQHHLLTAKHQQSTLWQHWASRQRGTTGMQQQLCKQFSNNEETQRQSNTRLSNIVCTRLTTVSTTAWTRSTTEDSSRWGCPSAGPQMGVHAQHQQANAGCSLLRV